MGGIAEIPACYSKSVLKNDVAVRFETGSENVVVSRMHSENMQCNSYYIL